MMRPLLTILALVTLLGCERHSAPPAETSRVIPSDTTPCRMGPQPDSLPKCQAQVTP